MSNDNPRKLSTVLQDALDDLSDNPSLQKISDQLGTRAYGAFIVLLTLPNFIPGVSILSGTLLLLFSLQMALGIEKPWLPKFIGNVCISKATLEKGLKLALPKLVKIEHYIKPRLVIFTIKIAIRLIGLVIAFFSFVVLLPIPLSNFIPSIALLFIAFGMLQKDGVLVLISTVLGTIYCVTFIWFVWKIIITLITQF